MSTSDRTHQAARSRRRNFLRPTLAGLPAKWLTPPQIAREMGIEAAKVTGFIASGELRATNIAQNVGDGHRPRWRIKREWFDQFIESRGNVKPPTSIRRRGRRERYVPKYY